MSRWPAAHVMCASLGLMTRELGIVSTRRSGHYSLGELLAVLQGLTTTVIVTLDGQRRVKQKSDASGTQRQAHTGCFWRRGVAQCIAAPSSMQYNMDTSMRITIHPKQAWRSFRRSAHDCTAWPPKSLHNPLLLLVAEPFAPQPGRQGYTTARPLRLGTGRHRVPLPCSRPINPCMIACGHHDLRADADAAGRACIYTRVIESAQSRRGSVRGGGR